MRQFALDFLLCGLFSGYMIYWEVYHGAPVLGGTSPFFCGPVSTIILLCSMTDEDSIVLRI